MKIKRFVATNMRQALQNVRKEQGPNAVILSNRRVENGIEVVAAVDYDETLLSQTFGAKKKTTSSEGEEDHRKGAQTSSLDREDDSSKEAQSSSAALEANLESSLKQRTDSTSLNTTVVSKEKHNEEDNLADRVLPNSMHTQSGRADVRQQKRSEPVLDEMRKEMRDIRLLLADQLSSLAWNDEVRRDPATVSTLRHFAAFGLDPDVARYVAAIAVEGTAAGSHLDRAAHALSNVLPVYEDDLLEQGGIMAIVGPTGVGKTTTIAKLAARFALRHGREQIALVSTDSFRIGAQEQLATFAQILDVPVHLVRDEDNLSSVLNSLQDKKLVLIDTAGVSQRAQGLSKHLSAFGSGNIKIKMYLTLAANGDSQSLDEVVREFGRVPLDGCILTKVDEAASLGPSFSTIIRHKLPVTYLANGQRVPEDLHTAKHRTESMVKYGMRLTRESRLRVDEDFMARNFGEVSTHAAA